MRWLALVIGLLADLLLFLSRSFDFLGKELETAGLRYIEWCDRREERAVLKSIIAEEQADESI
jgi:hypothetical protein